ncbi:MAG: chemotaxis response regulator protein-glutamate methylesterase [Methylococcaceae bacterium]|nr:chemotaxis response regulator protein-glutamate methylesterase [Methylococcaceae bacterium]
MAIRVLIVDDSRFICNRIQEILEEEPDFKVVGIASNGKQAILMTAQLKPDVITMDVEMPVMDGISAVKKIMAHCPTAILMFSATTHAGAQATLEALNAGAIDFLPKQLDKIDGDREMAKRLLRRRVRIVALQAKRVRFNPHINSLKTRGIDQLKEPSISKKVPNEFSTPVHHLSNTKIDLLVIVASTGGPVAIQKVLTRIPASCSFPILIVQHMPHNFTKSFADRLNQLCSVKVKEATNGDVLTAGEVLIGPGGMQMEVSGIARVKTISIREKQSGEIYSPCADITLTSIAKVFSSNVLTVVLTGMGADGKEGVNKLKQKGFSIWAQDEASCTIYGMPKAIVDANLADRIYSLDEIANEFEKLR